MPGRMKLSRAYSQLYLMCVVLPFSLALLAYLPIRQIMSTTRVTCGIVVIYAHGFRQHMLCAQCYGEGYKGWHRVASRGVS